MDAGSIKAMSTPCIYILVVSLLQELALRSVMSPVTIVQEVDGGLPRLTLTRLKVCSRLRLKNIQIHHQGDGRNGQL